MRKISKAIAVSRVIVMNLILIVVIKIDY